MRRVSYVLRLLAGLVVISSVLGLLMAGLLLPTVGAAGSATKGSIHQFNAMPDKMTMSPLAQQTKILASDGSVIATPYNDNRIPVPLNKIAPVMRQAQVAIEDQRFYQHGGVDTRGVLRALTSNFVSGNTQGASTLTQQYVKVALQNQALAGGDQDAANEAVSRSGTKGYVRKLQQLKYAVALEKQYKKDDILDGYLNLVYFGDQAYGVEAAALHYYGVHASQLNLNQAATLAGVVNAPGVTDPINYPENAKVRRNLVLQKMYENKYISLQQLNTTKREPITTHPGTQSSGSCASSKYPYFCYYVQAWLRQQPALGKDESARDALLKGGGLTIKTTFDPKIAAIVDQKIRARVPAGNSADVQSGGVVVQPGTGNVLAMAQNTDYSNTAGAGKSAVNFEVPGNMGGGPYGFDFGSTDKLFTIVHALKSGLPLDSSVRVPKSDGNRKGGHSFHVFTNADFPGTCGMGKGEKWALPNDAEFKSGPMTLSDMTAQSVNTAFASLVSQFGACNVRKTMTQMGLRQGNGKQIDTNPSAITLGTSGVAPVVLAASYATITAGGKWCPAKPVLQILDAHNKTLPLQGTACKQVLSKDVASSTVKIFRSVLESDHSTTSRKALLDNGKRPAWGKTGTTDSAKDTWFIGSTPQMTTAVWVGRFNSNEPLTNITLANQTYGTKDDPYVYGGTLAAPIWASIMNAAHQGLPIKQFPEPPASAKGGKSLVSVPDVAGQSVAAAQNRLTSAGFKVKVGGAKDSDAAAGLVGDSNPGPGSKMPRGITVTIFPSTGHRVDPEKATANAGDGT